MNLFIVWNSYSILEFLAVEKKYKDFFVYIDPFYNKENFNNINEFINMCLKLNIFKGLLKEVDLYNLKFDKLYCMSNLNDDLVNLLLRLNFKDLNFLEEGLFDYLEHSYSDKEFYLCKRANLYLSNLKNFKYINYYKNIQKILFEERLINDFLNLFNLDFSLDFDLIFFTAPINIDFQYDNYYNVIISFLEENFKGKNILLKKHPRDFINYESSKINFLEISSNIPGQLISMIYDCKKIYAFPSTIILSEGKLDNLSILRYNDLNSNILYNESFNHKKIKQCKIIEI